MGFVVEQHLNDTLAEEIPRTNIAVVYGKNDYMWKVGLFSGLTHQCREKQ